MTTSKTLLELGVMSPRSAGMASKTLERFVRDFKGLAKDKEFAKINKAVLKMANSFSLGVDEDDTEILEIVPEKLSNEKC